MVRLARLRKSVIASVSTCPHWWVRMTAIEVKDGTFDESEPEPCFTHPSPAS